MTQPSNGHDPLVVTDGFVPVSRIHQVGSLPNAIPFLLVNNRARPINNGVKALPIRVPIVLLADPDQMQSFSARQNCLSSGGSTNLVFSVAC